jgi:hypothetical protein
MPGPVPGIHVFGDTKKASMATKCGPARISQCLMPKSGKPDFGDKPGHDDVDG